MKKLLSLLTFFTLTHQSHAQGAKPTKEQTITYLNSIYANEVRGKFDAGSNTTAYVTVTNLKLNGCILDFSTSLKYSGDDQLYYSNYNLDLSKIEKIEMKDKFVYFITHNHMKLISVTNKENSEVKSYMESYVELPATIGSEKVIKAFNHLRKLCGAPEPIDFGE